METVAARHLAQVPITPVSPALFQQVLSDDAYRELTAAIVAGRALLSGRTVWNINSTARGGGVAEMLQSLVAYARGAGIDARWLVIQGSPEFFKVTKRIHNHIQGFEGDGGPLGADEHAEYERALAPAGLELGSMVRPGDIVLLHDPQTAGLVSDLKEAGALVVWRSHVGTDNPNRSAEQAWTFLSSYLADADAYVFSRGSFAARELPQDKITVIPPSIDPFSAKNSSLTRARAAAILISAGLMSGYAAAVPYFMREGGTMGFVSTPASVDEVAPIAPVSRIVLQVSRWDRLKDPLGVMMAFAQFVPASSGAHLVLAGPEVAAVSDDPEGSEVLNDCVRAWERLPEATQARVHLACLPMQDLEENAAIVNALQSLSEVVVQKSLAEGFGLTVTEAMWKARPVVASRIGGIQDQVEDQKTGILLDDPTDLAACGKAITKLLAEPKRASELGVAGRERVRQRFLSDRHLRQYVELFASLT